jgi:DNA (cytosine-5)-methyltransferase 1
MRYLSVCSGIEAASVAWHDFGWTPVGFSEIEKFPSEVLAKRFPDVKNYGDMTRYKEWDIDGDTVDLLVGGTPCQAFSVAGLRKGLEDPRGNLSLVFVGMVEHFKPEWVVWENVPGVLSSNGGRDFGSFIGALASIGYGFAWRCLDAQHFGVPQRRRRIFLVGHSSGDSRRAGEVLFEPESLRGDTTKGRTKGKGSTRGSASSVDSNGIPKTVGTICADTHPGAYSGQDAYTGRLIPVLYQNNQTDARLKEEPHTSQTVLARWGTGGGNAPIVQHTYRKSRRAQSTEDFETWVPDEVTNTLNCFDVGDVRSTDIVVNHTRVRRLTVTECERLQGFPDGWTDVRTNTPDSPRYKAIGNSMAVPCMRWLGKRIQRVI